MKIAFMNIFQTNYSFRFTNLFHFKLLVSSVFPSSLFYSILTYIFTVRIYLTLQSTLLINMPLFIIWPAIKLIAIFILFAPESPQNTWIRPKIFILFRYGASQNTQKTNRYVKSMITMFWRRIPLLCYPMKNLKISQKATHWFNTLLETHTTLRRTARLKETFWSINCNKKQTQSTNLLLINLKLKPICMNNSRNWQSITSFSNNKIRN
jgi:hypothetical protein